MAVFASPSYCLFKIEILKRLVSYWLFYSPLKIVIANSTEMWFCEGKFFGIEQNCLEHILSGVEFDAESNGVEHKALRPFPVDLFPIFQKTPQKNSSFFLQNFFQRLFKEFPTSFHLEACSQVPGKHCECDRDPKAPGGNHFYNAFLRDSKFDQNVVLRGKIFWHRAKLSKAQPIRYRY